MAGITDKAYRTIAASFGCGLTFTEMISDQALIHGHHRTKSMLDTGDEQVPAVVQIFGSQPQYMREAAVFVREYGARIIDINMGCPTPKIVKNGDGSALMQKPELVAQIVRKVSESVTVPVTVKMRKGWDDDSINAVEIACIAEENGAKAVTVHGRTREQFYTGKADWSIISKVKQAVKIPVIGNGDISSPEAAKAMLEETGCDGVMIGRGAEGNPWIFRRTVEFLSSGELLPEPSYEEKVEMALLHLGKTIELKGEFIGVKEMRKHLAWYLKSMPGAASIKSEVFKLDKASEVQGLLEDYLKHLSEVK